MGHYAGAVYVVFQVDVEWQGRGYGQCSCSSKYVGGVGGGGVWGGDGTCVCM